MESRVAKKTKEVELSNLQGFIAEMQEGLRIDKNGLDEALIAQVQLFSSVSEKLTWEISIRDAAKDSLRVIEAEVDEVIRSDAAEEGTKITESAIASQVRMHKDVREATAKLNVLNLNVGLLSSLKESYLQRSYALKELVALYLASYYGDGSAGRMPDAGTRRAEQNRREMLEERERRRKAK